MSRQAGRQAVCAAINENDGPERAVLVPSDICWRTPAAAADFIGPRLGSYRSGE
jgi:hypothetical protein